MEAIRLSEVRNAVQGKVLLGGNPETLIQKVSTNSKETMENGLFVPIIGERVDAHDFISGAFENGAVLVFTSRHKSLEALKGDQKISSLFEGNLLEGKTVIAVEDTLRALQELAVYYRSKFDLPVIGISGSVGKTTTKEMISAALSTKYKTLKTFGNMNSQIGVALMMFELDHEFDAAVIEMGISEPNEMDHLVRIAKPKYAVLTNIGVSHIGNLGSQSNIRKEKTKIVNEFGKDSVLYVNGNDELLKPIYEEAESLHKAKEMNRELIDLTDKTVEKLKEAQVCAFGTHEFCGFMAKDIVTDKEKTRFILVYPEGTEEIQLNVCGIHNVLNALVALAVAKKLGIGPSVAKEGLKEYQPIKMRGEIKTIGSIKVIDDTYNASPDSMKSGINTLLALSGVTRRIAVLADVLELGEISQEAHYGVGTFLADQAVDALITVGDQARFIAQGVLEKNPKIITHSFHNNEEANQFLQTFVTEGDGILVKGSRGMHTEQIVEAFTKRAQ